MIALASGLRVYLACGVTDMRSLAGLAPIARDSGQTRRKRFIRGGRAHLRQALFMPALVAVRFNATMKQKYESFVSAGKPKKLPLSR